MAKKDQKAPSLILRNARMKDIPAIHQMSVEIYGKADAYTSSEVRGQINNFPEGQFVAELNGAVIGYCASIIVSEEKALRKHTWRQITGNGYCSTHNPKGDYLYGVDVFVDPKYRKMRIGERLYQERRRLCETYGLKGIVFGGRMPLLRKRYGKVQSPQEYLKAVLDKEIRDPVINFQIRQGFEILGIIDNYAPYDRDSMGYAVHMLWKNPKSEAKEASTQSTPSMSYTDKVRVASVQYMQREIHSFEEFKDIITYFVDVVHDYRSDFVLFPEMFTLQLLSIEKKKLSPEEAILRLAEYTPRLKKFFLELAIKYNVNIIAGSHPTKISKGCIQNISYVFLRDGSVHEQSKIHPTPDERYWWQVSGGDELHAIPTDCGVIGVLICYDAEFPELARHLVDQGANIIFVPFCTDERQGYLRVRYCAHARAVENQCYVVLSGNVGNLPRVDNMDIQYGQSCILTPCDFSFARDGIAADTSPNVETVVFADLRLDSLYESRASGTVVNLSDRRHDLFSVVWHKKS